MKYKVYHILGEKIGVTTDIERRVVKEQGFQRGEFEILLQTDSIEEASRAERVLQQDLGYKVDRKLYSEVVTKPVSTMKHIKNNTATTTFKIPLGKLDREYLANLIIENKYGTYVLDANDKIDWVLSNVRTSQFNNDSCFVYNKALSNAGEFQTLSREPSGSFDELIAKVFDWADNKGILKGRIETQTLKLGEEFGELQKAVLKDDKPEIKDAIGDIIVVLTSIAYFNGHTVQDAVQSAYDIISKRTGKTNEKGDFIKD